MIGGIGGQLAQGVIGWEIVVPHWRMGLLIVKETPRALDIDRRDGLVDAAARGDKLKMVVDRWDCFRLGMILGTVSFSLTTNSIRTS